jgi:hypothetical protein
MTRAYHQNYDLLASLTHELIASLGETQENLHLALGFHTSHRKTRRRYRRLSLTLYPFLYDLYLDPSSQIVVKKGVQVMQTETFIIRAVLTPCREGKHVLYMLPTFVFARLFVKERIDKLFSRVPYYAHLLNVAPSTATGALLKHVGDGSVMFIGAGQETYVKAFAMDLIVYDEYDTLLREGGQEVVNESRDRIKSADELRWYMLGNPYAPDVMIDAEYQQGSQHRWMIPCDKCGTWQSLDFFRGVVRQLDQFTYEPVYTKALKDKEELPYLCQECDRPMDRFHPMAQWVASYPDRSRHSYHLSRLVLPPTPPTYRPILRTMRDDFFKDAVTTPEKMQHFCSSELGLGVTAGQEDITVDVVKRCCQSTVHTTMTSRGICVVGGDIQSAWWHFVVGRLEDDGSITVLLVDKHRDTQRFVDMALMGNYSTRLAVLDAQGLGERIIREQILSYDPLMTIVWMAYAAKKYEKILPTSHVVQYRRDYLLDDVLTMLRSHQLRLPDELRHHLEFLGHMTSNAKCQDSVITRWETDQ